MQVDEDTTSKIRLKTIIVIMIVVLVVILSLLYIQRLTELAILVIPMVVMTMFALCIYKKSNTDETEQRKLVEDRVLLLMKHHAIPAEQISSEEYRCPDCGHVFNLINCLFLEKRVTRCPACGVRLFI